MEFPDASYRVYYVKSTHSLGPMKKRDENLWHTCLAFLLRPAVRFCLKVSMTVQDIVELTKVTFVQLAVEELERTNEEVTVSRIRVATGLNRRAEKSLESTGATVHRHG